MSPATWLAPRRWSSGLWGVALLSALVVPVLVHVAGAHHAHWVGAGNRGWWGGLVVPWSARLQAAFGVLVVAGWAAWAAPPMPDRKQALIGGAVAGVGGAGVALLAAAPPWIWLYRIGAAAPGDVLGHMGWVGLAIACAGSLAGSVGVVAPGALASALGAAAGGAIVWAGWAPA